MANDEDRAALQKTLDQYRSNLRSLEDQAAQYGGEALSPLIIINQLRSTREQIAEFQARLRELDAAKTPEPTAPNASREDRSEISFGSGNDQRGANITIGDVAGRDIIKGNVDLPQLRQSLMQSFNDGELRDLCFDLGIDYDSLSGSGKGDKARELVAYAQRHGIMADLIAQCRRVRPNAQWPGNVSSSAKPDQATQPEPRASGTNKPESSQTIMPAEISPTQVVILTFQVQGNQAQIIWESPLLGSRTTSFTSPYTDDVLPVVIKALDAAQYPDHPVGGPQFIPEEQTVLRDLGLWNANRVPITAHRTVGQAIYQALGAEGRSALETVRSFGIAQGVQISYVLRFPREAVILAALPWEALWDRDQAVLLSRGNDVDSCERYMNIARALPPPLPANDVLHLLALSPSYNIPDIIRQEERTARLATWDSLKDQGLITYDEIGYDEIGGPLTVRKLTDYLRKNRRRPDIIHYFGHGIYKNGEGYLLFDDGAGGKSMVSSTRLAAMLGDVSLMVLLACKSATTDNEDGLLTGVAPALSLVTGAVVAMQLTVRIAAATRFSEIFYDELLGLKHSLQDAVAEARQTLFFEEDDGASWYVPTLYIRSREQKSVYMWQAM